MRPLPEAQRRVLGAMQLLPEAEVPLAEAAGLVLAVPVQAPHDMPPFDNSAMDGYAVRAADTAGAPVSLEVVEDVPAGRVPAKKVTTGMATKIMTGAPLPAGADAVVMVEDTEQQGDRVLVGVAVERGSHVRSAGGDIEAGATVFSAGERLDPRHLGVLATLGVDRPRVRRRLRVAILSTGDELVAEGMATLAPGQIRDANRRMLTGYLEELGADSLDLGIVPDDGERLRATLLEAAACCDVVVTSGGVSVGEYDLVKEVLGELGGIEFWRVAMQPGKPFAFGFLDETPLFGLPGNPVSVTVSFEQLVRPALLRRMGARRLFRPRVLGRLAEAVNTEVERTVFVRVSALYRDGEWTVSSSGGQDSNVLSALARADAFAVVPVGVERLPAGSEVELEMFRWPETRTFEEVLG
jgi:molybdopterin molybdotransferase